MKKLLTVILAGFMLFGGTITAYAEGDNSTTTPNNQEQEVIRFVENNSLDSDVLKTQYSVEVDSERAIDLSESIRLSGGDTYKKRFKTERWWFLEDHNAFKIELSNVKGSYKVMILGETGYFYQSNDYSGTGVTITVSNVKPDKNYTVSVINTSSNEELTADLVIRSFKE